MAIQYELNLTIDAQDLKIIDIAQQRVILAKPVNNSAPNVAWVSFKPFQNNVVTWEEAYGLYASTSKVESGAKIFQISSQFPSLDGAYYSFLPNANFGGPYSDPGAPPAGSFKVVNDMPATSYPILTMGLLQAAILNNSPLSARPLNAQPVPALNFATFTPLTEVQVWLETSLIAGTVITEVTSPICAVTFGGSTRSINLKYESSQGGFVAVGRGDFTVRQIEAPGDQRLALGDYRFIEASKALRG